MILMLWNHKSGVTLSLDLPTLQWRKHTECGGIDLSMEEATDILSGQPTRDWANQSFWQPVWYPAFETTKKEV